MITLEDIQQKEQNYVISETLRCLGQDPVERFKTETFNTVALSYKNYWESRQDKVDFLKEFEVTSMIREGVLSNRDFFRVLKSVFELVFQTNTSGTLTMLQYRMWVAEQKVEITEKITENTTNALINQLATDKAFTTATYMLFKVLGTDLTEEETNKTPMKPQIEELESTVEIIAKTSKSDAKRLSDAIFVYQNMWLDAPYLSNTESEYNKAIEKNFGKIITKETLDNLYKNQFYTELISQLQIDFFETINDLEGV